MKCQSLFSGKKKNINLSSTKSVQGVIMVKKEYTGKYFFLFLHKNVLSESLEAPVLSEVLLMSTDNICLRREVKYQRF